MQGIQVFNSNWDLPQNTNFNQKLNAMNNEVKRTPRLRGLTYLSIEYQKNPTDLTKENVIKHIVTTWALAGFRWNNNPINLYNLASIIGVNPSLIMEQLSKVGTNLGGMVDVEKVEDTLKSIITLSTTWAMQDRGLIMKQTEDLMAHQGNTYKPFVSSEVNKSLKLVLESNKNLMESYKTFFSTSTSTTNILNVINKEDDKEEEETKEATPTLTPDEALSLINQYTNDINDSDQLQLDQEQGRLSPSSNPAGMPEDMLQGLFKEHGVDATPDCREMRTGTEALRALGPESLDTIEPESHKPKKRQSSHTNAFKRRGEPEDTSDSLPS